MKTRSPMMHSMESRDAGLIRVVGPISLAASMVSIVVGAGIFLVPAQLSASMGPLAPLAFLACALVVGAIGLCMAESGSRVPSSGGIYASIEAAFGPGAGYVAGLLFCLSNLLACAAVSSALGDAVAAVVPPPFRESAHITVVVSTIALVTALNARGVSAGVSLVGLTTAAKLVPLGVFLVVGAFAMHPKNFSGPGIAAPAALARALLFALYTMQGFEAALCVSGEVRQPERTIPRAILVALATVTVLYIAIQVIAQGILGPALARSNVPLADAMGMVHPALRVLMLAGAAISMFGFITADVLSSPRILFAFARDGLLPRALGRINRHHAPHVAIAVYSILTIILALSGSFAQLAVPATLVLASIYIGSCLAAWQLTRSGFSSTGTPLGCRWIGAAATVGIGGMLALIVLASWKEIVGLLALAAMSLLAYLIQTRSLAGQNSTRDDSGAA
jgi:basic amino acid/polyamine antiporter, APA family